MFTNIVFAVLFISCAFSTFFLWQLKNNKPLKNDRISQYMRSNITKLAHSLLLMGRDTPADRKEWVGQFNFVFGIATFLACLVAVYFGKIHVCIPLVGLFALTREFNAEMLQHVEFEIKVMAVAQRRMNRDIMDGCRNLNLSGITDVTDKL
ncbi:hypothetical protein Xoosp14_251 [Xanthomonas phage Xoo-sp14]|nr:hypothetical protein Xoosp14_251 [Xanthomonas phage Xoo-sp14]